MSGPRREPNPDSPPRDDDRGSIEQVDQPRERDDDAPDARNGAVGGTDGVTRNQDDDAQ